MDRRTSLIALRWVAGFTLSLLLLFRRPPLAASDVAAWSICLALVASNLALHIVPRRVLGRELFQFLVFLLDFVLVSVTVYLIDPSGLTFFATLMLSTLAGAVTGDPRSSFLIALFASAFYLLQIHLSLSGPAHIIDPGMLLKVPLLLVFATTAGFLSKGSERAVRRRSDTIIEFDRRLRMMMTPEEVATTVCESLARVGGYSRIGLYLSDGDPATLIRVEGSIGPGLPEVLSRDALPESLRNHLDRKASAAAEHLAATDQLARQLGLKPGASFIVPVRFSDRPLGLMVAEHKRRMLAGEAEAEFLDHLAGRAASAIMNARTVQAAQQSVIGLHSLLKMSETVTSSLHIPDILSVLDAFCHHLVGVRNCRVWVRRDILDERIAGQPGNGGRAVEGIAEGGGEDGASALDDPLDRFQPLGDRVTAIEVAAARKVLSTGSELVANAPEALAELLAEDGAEDPADPGVENLMAWPLSTGSEILGILEAIDKPEPFHQRDHSLLAGLVSQATIALVNARLYEGLEARAIRISRLVETLAAEKQKLEHVLRNMEEGVILIDGEGRVTLANHSGRRLLQPRGRIDLPAGADGFADPLALLARFSSVLTTGVPVHETVPHGERYFEVSATRLAGQDGVIAVLRDITEAVRMNAMRSDFVSHVSHELRTPLAAIVGSIKLMQDGRAGDLSETQSRLLNVVERESERLMQLIDDLLDLARLEAGKTSVARETVDLGTVIREAVESFEPLALTKSIALTTDLAEIVEPVPCDPGLIRQVLHNLLGNAIKFTPEGGAVRIEADTAGERAEVRVRDTGIGIPHDKREAVFDKFEQLAVKLGPVKGSGLGLAICRQIIEHHGGRIGVQSEEGVGSTFWFTLPLVESAAETTIMRAA